MVHSLRLQVGDLTLVARCDPALHIEAESVLRLLGTIDATGNELHDGSQIALGWSLLSLRARDGVLVLCEPAFDGNPFVELREDITQTLSVIVDQSALVQRLGVASQPTAFHQHVTVTHGALAEHRIVLERREPTSPADSGWHLGPMTMPVVDAGSGTMPVYALLQVRPALLAVLALPTGSLVTFDGDAIVAVLDEHCTELWQAS
jgi:hypothetical protein